jgi:predicted aminopeptidase
MGRAGLASKILLLATVSLAGCSPIYVAQSAAGHADLLIRRKSIETALKDPRTPPSLRAPLETAASARKFAFERMGLARSRDFSTYVLIDRPAVTWLVSASSRTALSPYQWRFPFAGRFPYKGYFTKKDALAERDRLEAAGWDASVGGAAAYNTPLPLSDPLPSPALSYSTGALAALMIHELSHGSLEIADMAVNEAAAQFIGVRAARQYLAERFGDASPEAAVYEKELEKDAAVDAAFARLRSKLSALYAEPVSDEEKLRRRAPLFEAAKAELGYERLNNAVVTAHGVYHEERGLAALFETCGRDWRRFLAELNRR